MIFGEFAGGNFGHGHNSEVMEKRGGQEEREREAIGMDFGSGNGFSELNRIKKNGMGRSKIRVYLFHIIIVGHQIIYRRLYINYFCIEIYLILF